MRGVVLTDALIGTFAPNVDETLAGNRCFLYHVIGGGTGDWDVPGRRHGRRQRRALAGGGRRRGDPRERAPRSPPSPPTARSPTGTGDDERTASRRGTVLANVAPYELARLLGPAGSSVERPEGAQVKVNLLLKRLPRLRDATLDPAAAFGGTFHANESWSRSRSRRTRPRPAARCPTRCPWRSTATR